MNFDQIHILGEAVRTALGRANHDERKLPEIAASELEHAALDTDFDLVQVAKFLLETQIKQQPDLHFSDLPLVLYRCQDFYIEMLIWVAGSTSIHQHGFSGAFRVLAGSSVHTEYEFEERDRISSRLLLGETRLRRTELLRAGDVRQITSGRDGLLHALFHLDQPSVTLVVRNKSEPWALPQYSILKPQVAYASRDLDADTRVRIVSRLVNVTNALDHEKAVRILVDEATRLDFPRLFMVLTRSYPILEVDEDWQPFIEAARSVHGELTDHLIRVAETLKRENSILATREIVTDPELRCFLALLLNVPSRSAIYRLVRKRFSHDSPEKLCSRWLTRLGNHASIVTAFQQLAERARLGPYRFAARLSSALPFDDDDPKTEALLMAVIDGLGSQEIITRLTGMFGQDQIDPARLLEAHARLNAMPELDSLRTEGRASSPR